MGNPGLLEPRRKFFAPARVRAHLITSWYTERHRQCGFLDHPCLCGLRAQASGRSLLETAGTGGWENLAVGLPRPREELASASRSTISHRRARELGKTLNRVGLSTCPHPYTKEKGAKREHCGDYGIAPRFLLRPSYKEERRSNLLPTARHA